MLGTTILFIVVVGGGGGRVLVVLQYDISVKKETEWTPTITIPLFLVSTVVFVMVDIFQF